MKTRLKLSLKTPEGRPCLRKTKIIATVSEKRLPDIRELFLAGVNIFRINAAHGSHQNYQKIIRQIRKETQGKAKILGDLAGPKIRVGKFVNGSLKLEEGKEVALLCNSAIGVGFIPCQYAGLINDIKVGQKIFLDDGNMEIQVQTIESKSKAICKVIQGGILTNHKSLNIPGANISIPTIGEKDIGDLDFFLRHKVDFLCLSFVRKAEDVLLLRKALEKISRASPYIIAKIEKPEALQNKDEIVHAADGIMIARRDLGIEIPIQKVPIEQKKLIELARSKRKPVIVATQMLESMVLNKRPTLAEVNDIANAVWQGASALMLSAETAVGKYPIASVKMMDAVIREVEFNQLKERAKPA